MTAPVLTCSSCNATIPRGALYCLSCGAPSPTEGVPAYAAPPERPSGAGVDVAARRAEVQAALGDGFEVKRLIGRGGFGEVWEAADLQLGRAVAVKVLRPEISAKPDFRKRFRREARAVARLRHPAIVPIYHVGETAGLVWFIMPLVEGVTLRAALAAGGLSAAEAVRILVEVSGALGEAHRHHVIHRDIKPENIMLEGPQRHVLLMDFGVAKVEEPGGGEHLTEADMVFGSPEYMSPEQATARPLDARSDLYSLGVVAYRMLAGRLPFEAGTPREMLAHHVLSAPRPLTEMPGVSTVLAEAVMRCLAKEPGQRWQSAEAFARSLTDAAPVISRGTAPVPVATPVTRLMAAARSALRRPLPLAGIAVLAVLVLWGGIAWWRNQRRFAAAGTAVAALYRGGADSLTRLAAGLARGDLTASQLVGARDELMASIAEQIDESHGAEVEDSLRWPAASRRSMETAATAFASAGAQVATFELKPSAVSGCALTVAGDSLLATDRAPRDNCWFAADGAVLAGRVVEYVARFRLVERPGRDAGVGLAWCRKDGECRVAFLWPRAATVFGAHRPRQGLHVLALGARALLAPGAHEVRARWQAGTLRCLLDGRAILTRSAPADAEFLERPASLDLIVQNTRVALDGSRGLFAAAVRDR